MYMSEKDRFLVRRVIADNSNNKHCWAPWFAWRPVRLTTNNELVWMRRIYRRAQYKTYSTWDDRQQYEYGTIICILRLPDRPQHQGL